MILVTGGTGFVGTRIVHALRAHDLRVRCLVRDRSKAAQLEAWGCELVEGDVTDAESVRRAVEGCDAVVHLVAIITGKPAEFERVMTQATRDLVAAAADARVGRFVLMSALGVTEETKHLVPYYGAKWEMEQAVKSSGLEHVIFRPSFVFGPGGGAIRTFARLARLPFTPVVGSGKQRIQPIWVDDVAELFAQAIGNAGAANRTFEIGGPDVVDWNELYARIKRTLGKKRPVVHMPMALMRAQAVVFELLPSPPVTRDQLTMLEAGDNTCDNGPALETFDVTLMGLDEQLRRSV
jgi:NADH dehydrogenase